MGHTLHITSGDRAGDLLKKSGVPGEVLVWHDMLYDGPRIPGWPDEACLSARAVFLEEITGGGMDRQGILETLRQQYRRLSELAPDQPVVLWFDACLFDQSMLAHILTCLRVRKAENVELLCVDAFPGIEPFHGLGQLQPDQLAALYGNRQPVTEAQYVFAIRVDQAFAGQDADRLAELSEATHAPLPWVPAAVARWLKERPSSDTGLGELETLALAAIRGGCKSPGEIFASVAAADSPPQFWGDITLWAKINALADREPPLVKIDGPADRLPQWESEFPLKDFSITAVR
ncbi:DUF1835 domain-containing protein [Pontiella sp.]|uniref:DUF1835 domain-containing protein n=1 Tax=Pontiella sp. TaxID=2837462 RepID=UPI003561A1DB